MLQPTTAGQTSRFGCNPWADPTAHLGLPVTKVPLALRYSRLSVAIRVAFVVLLFIWLTR